MGRVIIMKRILLKTYLSFFNLVPTLDEVLRDIQDYRALKGHMNLSDIRKKSKTESLRPHRAKASWKHLE